MPIAIELPGLGNGYRLGAGVRVTSGAAAGRQLYCTASAGDILFCDGRAQANLVSFGGVPTGDTVPVDHHAFLAFCYYYRFHISDDPLNDFRSLDGEPLYRPEERRDGEEGVMTSRYRGY